MKMNLSHLIFLRTLLAFGFSIGFNEDHSEDRVKYKRPSAKYALAPSQMFTLINIRNL